MMKKNNSLKRKIIKIGDIFKTLEKGEVQYAVVGGVAVVLYGYVRFTKDIDLIIDFSKNNVKKFLKAISSLNFQPGVPIDPLDLANPQKRNKWFKEKNAQVITFYNPDEPFLQIDILITKELSQIKTEKKKIDDLEIIIISYNDLIKMKKESGLSVDLMDIERLEELKGL